jgi:uncharacterized DUF497 family protein
MCETAHSTSSEKTPGSTGQRFSGVPFSHMAFNRFDLLGGLGDPGYLMFFMDPIFIMENTILLGTEFDKKFDKKLQCSYNVLMSSIAFEWDPSKASSNQRKHPVNFEEAKSVFYDENAKIIHDPDHSISEDRFVILGTSMVARILVVIHCYRKKDSVIRIISARKATKKETTHYYGGDL